MCWTVDCRQRAGIMVDGSRAVLVRTINYAKSMGKIRVKTHIPDVFRERAICDVHRPVDVPDAARVLARSIRQRNFSVSRKYLSSTIIIRPTVGFGFSSRPGHRVHGVFH